MLYIRGKLLDSEVVVIFSDPIDELLVCISMYI